MAVPKERVYGITGGGGFLGYRLALMLLSKNSNISIKLLDIRPPNASLHTTYEWSLTKENEKKLIFVNCDLRNYEQVDKAVEGCDTIFHIASYGMSGKEMCNRKMIEEVNIGGTKNIIQACIKHNVKRLIYVSTYNVVFCGETIVNGNEETCAYVPKNKHLDQYSYTKCEAEKIVLKENREGLQTSAIRAAAIYGDGEERHTPRILNLMSKGLGLTAIGSPKLLCDWVFVDNLAYSLILADKKLSNRIGQAYFISDDKPVNNFEFLKQIIQPLGYNNIFLVYVPTILLFYLGYFLEIAQRLCSPFFFFTPMMNRAEVVKVGVTHYMNISKAKSELGYNTIVSQDEAIKRCLKWYSANGYKKKDSSSLLLLLLIVFMIALFIYMVFIK